ncbi:Uncharacterized conserved protein YacL, contains PIN and TRAM domains [Aristaeella lactis]|uniref:Uncharacterized conserved protein YacL, contains PIN and TRAM domains n=1 Tax=Aristaeella lactis TaxID=3046383 RepID=A0AC61PQY2_9FIRM|nr:Uncharacterized conserved protein YacL, contains PIN and TRAM domains [Aristaeella lactis]
MRSKAMEKLLRFLLVLLGIGVGLAAAQLGLALYRLSHQNADIPTWVPVAAYSAMAVVGGLLLLLLSRRIIRRVSSFSLEMQKEFDKMPANQLIGAVVGLILGLIVAALLRQMVSFLGDGVAGAALTAILYLTLGALGYNIGKRRSREFITMITRLSGAREKSKIRKHGYASRKYIDTSAIIDGRILEIAKTGFIEGEFVIPQFVVDELQHVADSSDDTRRERGRRGLEILREMRDSLKQLVIDPADIEDIQDVDVKLLRQARDCGGTVITVDYNLQKAAAVSGVKSLNVNELAEAFRPAVVQGMEMRVRLTREGKEAGQGVAYLDDGTMIVVENAKSLVGEESDILVTSVLQTSAGRMIFARLKN